MEGLESEMARYLTELEELRNKLLAANRERAALESELDTARGLIRDAEEETRRAEGRAAQLDNTLRLHQKSSEEVRSKLAEALDTQGHATWTDIVKVVQGQAQRRAGFSRERLAEMVDQFGDYLDELEESREDLAEHNNEKAKTIKELRAELEVFKRGDETAAGTWKGHFLDLATAIGVPRATYGNLATPQVDLVMRYVGQIMPAVKLSQRVEELEKRMEELSEQASKSAWATVVGTKETKTEPAPPPELKIDPAPPPELKIEHDVLCQCGHLYPFPAAFCPKCGKDAPAVPQQDMVDAGLNGQ